MYLIYIAYGADRYALEAICSISSLNFTTKRIPTIIIYTDRKKMIKKHFLKRKDILYEKLDETIVSDWIKPCNYIYIIKLKVLEKFIVKYKKNVILCDTDTFFLKDITSLYEEINHKKIIMHSKELKLSSTFGLPSVFISKNNLGFNNSNTLLLSYIWNSGTIGINVSELGLIKETVNTINLVYKDVNDIYLKKGYAPEKSLEQIILSLLIQKEKITIVPSERYLIHYWYFRNFIYVLYMFFFNELLGKESLEVPNDLKQEILNLRNTQISYENLPIKLFELLNKHKSSSFLEKNVLRFFPDNSLFKEFYFGNIN